MLVPVPGLLRMPMATADFRNEAGLRNTLVGRIWVFIMRTARVPRQTTRGLRFSKQMR